MTGESISHYEILEELGRGGMGVVYKARDTKLDRFVALKFLPPVLTQDESTRDRFVREAKAAAAIEHNHICTIHDIAETEDGRTYIVMSYYSGQALNERIADGPIPIVDALRYGSQAASALAAAHSAGIAHRDIKPGNLILTDSDEIKLVDFGLAKLAGQVDLTKSRSTVGTAAYMSPEQVKGEEVDVRTDIWSLGILMYEMVTGKRPFDGEYEQALSYAIVNVDPPALDPSNPEFSNLDSVIRGRLLVKNPEERHSSAAEISVLLQSFIQDSGIITSPLPLSKAGTRWNTRTIIARTAIVIAAISFGYWYINLRNPIQTPPSTAVAGVTRIAVLPFSLSGSQEYSSLGDGMVDLLSTKIDGAGSWHSVDPRLIIATVTANGNVLLDPATAARIAKNLSASLFVLGNMVEVGGRLRVDAAIYETSGTIEPIKTGTVQGNADELFELVDGLAAQLLINPDDASSERLSELAELTTSSVDALKAYLEGEVEFRAFNFVESATSFQRAVEIDSTFALAWYRLSVVTDWIAWAGLSLEAARKAVLFGQNVSDRDKMLFDAMLASRTGDLERSERLYNTILLRDPNDSEALFNLAELLFHDAPASRISYDAARDMWNRVLRQEPSSLSSLVHLARIEVYTDNHEKALGLIDQVLTRLPEGDRNPEFLGLKYISSGEPAFRDSMMVALESADLSTLLTTSFAVWAAELPISDLFRVFDLAAHESRGPKTNAVAYSWKSMANLAVGRLQDARAAINEIGKYDEPLQRAYELFIELHPVVSKTDNELRLLLLRVQSWNARSFDSGSNPIQMLSAHDDIFPLIKAYFVGRIAIRLGELALANDMIQELEKLIDERQGLNRLGSALGSGIRARMLPPNSVERLEELERAFYPAWFQFRIASPLVAMPEDRYERALILQHLGRHEESLVQFETLRHVTAPDFNYYVPGLLGKARSLIALGLMEEARSTLRRFLELWENADPEFGPFKSEARLLLDELG